MRRLAAVMLVLVAAAGACGTGDTTSASGPRPSVSRIPCPIPAESENPGVDCVPIDPNANISANNAYRDYKTPAPAAQAGAKPVKAKLPSVLDAVRAHPPVTEQSVSAALRAAFPELSSAIEVSEHAARIEGGSVGYGMFVGGACVHGWVGATGQNVEVAGVSNDGGCLPLLGH
jgi:hypothetical protein